MKLCAAIPNFQLARGATARSGLRAHHVTGTTPGRPCARSSVGIIVCLCLALPVDPCLLTSTYSRTRRYCLTCSLTGRYSQVHVETDVGYKYIQSGLQSKLLFMLLFVFNFFSFYVLSLFRSFVLSFVCCTQLFIHLFSLQYF